MALRDRAAFAAAAAATLALSLCSCGDEQTADIQPTRDADNAGAYRLPTFLKVQGDVQQLERMVGSEPKNPRHHLALGKTLLDGGITTRGESELRAALELDPTLDEAAALLSANLLSRGDAAGAQALIQRLLQAHDSAVLRLHEGRALLAQDPPDVARAEPAFRRALELDPAAADAAYELGVLLLRRRDDAAAIELLEAAVRLQPNHLGATFNLAQAYRRTGRTVDAERCAAAHRRLSALDDVGYLQQWDSLEAALALVGLYDNGGDHEAALAELDAAIERFPREPLPRVRRAVQLVRAGRTAEGEAAFEALLHEMPDEAAVLNQYALHLATAGGPERARRAVKLAEKAVQQTRRGDANVLDTLAAARAAAGDLAGALGAIGEALKLDPGDAALVRRRDGLVARQREAAKEKR